LLGRVIEAAGRSLHALRHREILRAIGMERSTFEAADRSARNGQGIGIMTGLDRRRGWSRTAAFRRDGRDRDTSVE